jgi:hypothetical protein
MSGYETLSLTRREEHKVRMYENKLLKRMFGTIREEIRG